MSTMYSSSDEDEKQRVYPRPNPPPPPPPFGYIKSKAKKKKKKTLPPQETINKIWSRFSVPKFSKATTILPFAPPSSTDPSKAAQAPKPAPNNLLVSEDFERAVQECRTKVRKLIKECKRVNMRYRDSSFDIDWDLKWEKGYCLNGLLDSRFEINSRTLSGPTSQVPKAVKRVHEIFNKPTFLKENGTPAEVKQGNLGDCWLMASLTALVNMEVGIQRICVEYDTKIGIYGFVFHRDGEWIISIIDDKLYLKSPDWDSPSVQRHLLEQTDREDVEKEYRNTYQSGSQALFFAHCRDQNETWLPLLEKAYAKAHGDYAALAGGWIGEGLEDLTGGVTTELLTSDILDTDEFWTNEIMKVNKEFLFGCSTGLLDGGYGNRDGISEGHAYVIMEARELSTGQRLLKLRNPWGKGKRGNWEGAWSDGSKEFTPEAQLELNHKFGGDTVFWISFEDLLRKYQHFDRTRLFMDCPDWRITQKWISVEVPWHAEFEQKFRIVLKKTSPVVLVLSQLDNRYFDGLQGQYNFRLQFRLHEVDSLGEEDYIVRSHGNYLMERSVVTELQSLPAGTYAVFIQVVADRDTDMPSVEDVVKSQCRRKVDNDKLAQVGAMYDLAHSKAEVYTKSKATARKAQDRAKIRESRVVARQKSWEKDQLRRNIMRKQEKKNQEKRERKAVKCLAEEKQKEMKEPKEKGVQTEDTKEIQITKEDKGIQTEELPHTDEGRPKLEFPLETITMNETDKAIQTETFPSSPTASHYTPETPNTISINTSPQHRNPFVGGPPLPPPGYNPHHSRRKSTASSRRYPGPPPGAFSGRRQYITSEGESSASPVSDYADFYSDDDPTIKTRPLNDRNTPPLAPNKRPNVSDDEDEPEPWNAVCIVGFRVYSKDSDLEVKIFDDEIEESEILEKKQEEDAADADIEDRGKKDMKLKDIQMEPTESKETYLVEELQLSKRSEESKENILQDEPGAISVGI